MKTKKGIYSNRCWVEGTLQPAVIYYKEGIITEIHKGKPNNISGVEDAGNKVVMPGVIDAHVHINEPGRTDWEGFDTGTQAAAAGGITTIIDMPLNASPVTISLSALRQKLQATEGKLHVNCGFYAGLVPGSFHDLKPLLKDGILGIKVFLAHSGIDEFANVGEKELDEAMPLIAKHHLPLLVHCELTDDVIHSPDFNEHPRSYQNYLASRPKSWENKAIELMIKLCRKHKCAVHIVHVSSAEALAAIAAAKQEGLPITAETCPQYIYFNAEDIPDGNTLYKCAPPIRERENNQQLKEALLNGTLDFLASDHSPAPPAIKELESGNLQKAWGGIAGLQFLLPAGWTALRETMPLERFIPLLTANPAKFLDHGNKKGELKIGCSADFIAWSPEDKFEVMEKDILHRHKISPYIGKQLYGVVHQTYVNGLLVYSNKNIITKTAGRWLLKK